jgi:hypothetical protein
MLKLVGFLVALCIAVSLAGVQPDTSGSTPTTTSVVPGQQVQQHEAPAVSPKVGPTATFPPNPGGGHCGIWPEANPGDLKGRVRAEPGPNNTDHC